MVAIKTLGICISFGSIGWVLCFRMVRTAFSIGSVFWRSSIDRFRLLVDKSLYMSYCLFIEWQPQKSRRRVGQEAELNGRKINVLAQNVQSALGYATYPDVYMDDSKLSD